MNQPILSICIPTYNRALILKETLEDILKFASSDIEIVISDNNSQDETMNICKNFKDSRLSYYKNEENIGFCKNVILALKRAKGNYVMLLKDTDRIEHLFLEKYIPILKQKEYNSIFGSVIRNEGGNYFTRTPNKIVPSINKNNIRHIFRTHGTPGFILKKELLNFNTLDKISTITVFPQLLASLMCGFHGNALFTRDTFCKLIQSPKHSVSTSYYNPSKVNTIAFNDNLPHHHPENAIINANSFITAFRFIIKNSLEEKMLYERLGHYFASYPFRQEWIPFSQEEVSKYIQTIKAIPEIRKSFNKYYYWNRIKYPIIAFKKRYIKTVILHR